LFKSNIVRTRAVTPNHYRWCFRPWRVFAYSIWGITDVWRSVGCTARSSLYKDIRQTAALKIRTLLS
jgi:hypothetical protein